MLAKIKALRPAAGQARRSGRDPREWLPIGSWSMIEHGLKMPLISELTKIGIGPGQGQNSIAPVKLGRRGGLVGSFEHAGER